MKAISSTLLVALYVGVSVLSLPLEATAQTVPPKYQENYEPAKKPSFFSRFRRKPAPQQPAEPQVTQVPKRGFGLRLPKFRKPDFSRISKPKLPKMSLPKLRKPNVSMPKMRWPFRKQQAVNQTTQNYPNGVRNPEIGGAYGIVQADRVKFYEVGPSQAGGPDASLDRGTLVTIRSNDRSWAYVTLRDGQSGYVGLDQVRLASTKEAPKAKVRSTKPKSSKKRKRSSYLVKNEKKQDYVPPALPSAAADLPASPEVNPLLQTASLEEQVVGEIVPLGGNDVLVDSEPQPVDSPEVLFDPILDPLAPSPSAMPGGPEPFLTDPIPSIEEELRAIQEAKAQADALPSESGE